MFTPQVVGYTWVIPLKPTARAIQKDGLDKKEEKYNAYRKRPTANYYYFQLHSTYINFHLFKTFYKEI